MTDYRNLLVSFFFFCSGVFILLAAMGIRRLPDLYCRMHALTKATTIAKIFSFIGAALYFYQDNMAVIPKLFLVIVFLFATTPVSAHLIARAGYKRGAKPDARTWHDDYSKEF